jgi:hypothetical protein
VLSEIHLETQAVTSGGYNYPVILRKGTMGWVLSVQGTPGTWYMESIDSVGDRLALDYGQGWYLENATQLVKEARHAIYRNV